MVNIKSHKYYQNNNQSQQIDLELCIYLEYSLSLMLFLDHFQCFLYRFQIYYFHNICFFSLSNIQMLLELSEECISYHVEGLLCSLGQVADNIASGYCNTLKIDLLCSHGYDFYLKNLNIQKMSVVKIIAISIILNYCTMFLFIISSSRHILNRFAKSVRLLN